MYDPENKEQYKTDLPGSPKYRRLESLVEENEQSVSKHPEGVACTAMDIVALELCRPKIWQKLHTETTEMIVNESGRQMSPPISVRISGLEKSTSYAIWVHFQRDGNAWTWCPQEMKWKVNDVDDTINEPIDHPQMELYCHQWITAPGDKWMEKPISFQNLRLTSDLKNTRDVFLYPNHRYTPVVYLVALDGQQMITNSPVSFFPLDLAQFICSKSYRNRKMACLKIELNPRSRKIHSRGRQQAPQRQSNHTSKQSNSPDDCFGCIQTGVRYGFLPSHSMPVPLGSSCMNSQQRTRSITEGDAQCKISPCNSFAFTAAETLYESIETENITRSQNNRVY
ncbi:hypothetical protein SARC_02912 [Sphaeroforma arctica JP610]|uniref:T-box domain-containing protein n=1 Tax=Sphaeroforma arctica JP610 TaxID=667725 RepID=A0A0L0G9D4_9EUKA|nr:hypothetical protein SARC_02912 [Sphaeroforma arctica JP610]KNC84873.1 hypothetical protein SARC_02912 [Sphaeroforma arctica JP610]|eukprot:XP_014158775.1 hypothetical protein SARC_02912 [Sphaeroforma arctica JP610]